jgi:hypothetical protein
MSYSSPWAFCLGLDLGQSRDVSALAILQEPLWADRGSLLAKYSGRTGWIFPSELENATTFYPDDGSPPSVPTPYPPLKLAWIGRFELKTKYTAVVDEVTRMIRRAPLSELPTILVIDKTGVGAGPADAFEREGINLATITIHSGTNVIEEAPNSYRVPKRELANTLETRLRTGRLWIPEGLEGRLALIQEMLTFRWRVNPKIANDSYSHRRPSDKDDLVLATAMAAWFRDYYQGRFLLNSI